MIEENRIQFLCVPCAEANGGVWPKGSVVSPLYGECPVCGGVGLLIQKDYWKGFGSKKEFRSCKEVPMVKEEAVSSKPADIEDTLDDLMAPSKKISKKAK